MYQSIEGYRISRLGWGAANAQPITLAFWAYAFRAGMYSGAANNGAFNRSYPFAFTINASNTWEYKTITIAGDTTGTWRNDNGIGLSIRFNLMIGTTYQAAAGAWIAGAFMGVTGSINGVQTTSDTLLITGVTVLPGTEAPTSARAPLIMRPYGQVRRLPAIQRRPTGNIRGVSDPGGFIGSGLQFSPSMRAAPACANFADGSVVSTAGKLKICFDPPAWPASVSNSMSRRRRQLITIMVFRSPPMRGSDHVGI